MTRIRLKLKRVICEEGQTVVEYCIMVGVVALAIVALSPNIATAVSSFFGRVSTQLGLLS